MTGASKKLAEALSPFDLALFYSVDPGAFAAMRPVVAELAARKRPVRWVLDGWSLSHESAGLEHWTLDVFRAHVDSPDAARSTIILGSQTDCTATRRMIQDCAASGIYTFFLFDHWSHYVEHFLDRSNGHLVLPDVICVMDRFAAQAVAEILESHGQQTDVMTVGHPALEAQVEDIRSRSEDEIRALRRRWDAESSRLQAFLLEPVELDFPGNQVGYTEYTVLEYFFQHVADPAATVVVRPHPRQDVGDVRHRLGAIDTRGNRIVVSDLGTASDLIAAADEVYGMTSVALILSILVGKPTWSLQVGRNEYGRQVSNPQLEEIVIV